MPVSSYVVFTDPGVREAVARSLMDFPACDVVPAEAGDVILLVAETDDLAAEADLRDRVEAFPGVRSVVFAFGDVDPDTPEGDPLRAARRGGGRRSRAASVVADEQSLP